MTYENNRHTTIGQELIDLRKAYDEKIITTDEYEKLKLDITSLAALSKEME